jgi:cytoskeletal protein RodZ
MTNKSIDPLFVSALDVLTGALGVFIILNFLNTRLAGTTPPAPPPVVAEAKHKTEKRTTAPTKREERPSGQRWSNKPAPAAPKPTPTTATPEPKPESKPAPAPVENQPPAPPQDPVAVDLMKQTKGVVTLLLQQEGKAKQSVEFMLRQGSKSWKPSRASKYQNEEFKYEKALNYFYQENIQPGTHSH